METNNETQGSQTNLFLLSRRKIVFIIIFSVFLLSVVAAGAYYAGRIKTIYDFSNPQFQQINSVPTLQATPTYNTPTLVPLSPTNNFECQTNADCPARNGCFIYQCISNECRRINMCTNESPNYPQ